MVECLDKNKTQKINILGNKNFLKIFIGINNELYKWLKGIGKIRIENIEQYKIIKLLE
jgi:hypothetical protein